MRGVVAAVPLLVGILGGAEPAFARTATLEVAAPEAVRWGGAGATAAGALFRLSVTGAIELEAAQGGVSVINLRAAPGGVRQNAVVDDLALAGGGLLPVGFADLAVLGWVDLVDERGRRIARDRAAAVVVSAGRALVVLPGLSWDGRAEPVPGSAHHYLVLSWDAVTLAEPSREPGTLVERRDSDEQPVGGRLQLELFDDRGTARDRIERLSLQVARSDGTRLQLAAVELDSARGGIVVNGIAPHLGWVRAAVWARCDILDGVGRTLVQDAPLRLWVGKDGVAHVDVDGVLSLLIRAAR